METCATICKIDSQSVFAVQCRGLSPGLCGNLEAWDAVGGGREAQEGRDIRIPTADPWWCKAETNRVS